MKFKISLIALFICSLVSAQETELTPKEIEANRQFELAKANFSNKQYTEVLEYYNSLSVVRFDQFYTYKMASESCLELAEINTNDSLELVNRSNEIYNRAVRWIGKMYVEEIWDFLNSENSDKVKIHTLVDEKPEFPGGMSAFYEFIGQNMRYPSDARRMGIEGRVYIQFIVNKDGSIDAQNVVKGIGSGCDEEALRVMEMLPNFIPGKQDGEPVYVMMVMPIYFKLAGSKKKQK